MYDLSYIYGIFIPNRNHDYENFLATLLIKGESERRSALAVRAFNVEVAKVAGSVRYFIFISEIHFLQEKN